MKEIDKILQSQLNDIKEQGTFKEERVIETAQESEINVNGRKVLNLSLIHISEPTRPY